MAFKNEDELREIINDLLQGVEDIAEIEDVVNEKVNAHLANREKVKEVQQDIIKQKKEELKLQEKSAGALDKISEKFGKISSSIEEIASGEKLYEATNEFLGGVSESISKVQQKGAQKISEFSTTIRDQVSEGVSYVKEKGGQKLADIGGSISESMGGALTAVKGKARGVFSSIGSIGKAAFSGLKVVGVGALTGVLLLGQQIVQQFMKIDSAASDLAETAGVLDDTFSSTLIDATQSSKIIGGNIQLAADAAAALYDELSPAVPLTGRMVGNVASIAERFGLGVEKSAKLTRIISETLSVGIDEASQKTTSFIEGLGRLGPAVTRNITESYEEVINSFGLGLKQLRQQGLAATRLGISLKEAANVSEGLLDISSSITSEFRARALLGGQLNLQAARQKAFQGDIVGANQEILNQVEKIGDLSKLNHYQREALAEATGKTVAELQRELRIRKQIGAQNRINEATRRSVLTRFEAISRRISGAFFRIVSSKEVQNMIELVADKIVRFLDSGGLENLIKMTSNLIDGVSRLLGKGTLSLWGMLTPWDDEWIEGGKGVGQDFNMGGTTVKNVKNVKQMNDGIITNRGEVVSTNPRDYIIATQTPSDLTNDGGMNEETKQIMREVKGLLKHLKENGVKAGDTYLDSRKVSKGLANSMR